MNAAAPLCRLLRLVDGAKEVALRANQLGAEEIDRIVDEAVQLFGGFRVTVTEPDPPTRTPAPKGRALRVLN